ncbi:MAG: TonB-dependent receptor, partial [Bacteroidales bacterium]|nr:TonB-dependent receptor [Bacteroidales bacterium]
YERTFITPRLHLKWTLTDWMTVRLSSGKGFRTPFYYFTEYHYLLASERQLQPDATFEEAWNSGISMDFYVPLGKKKLKLNAEYYYTDFIHQNVVDYDADPTRIIIHDLTGSSFSHTVEVDASYDFSDELNILSAFRYNYVRCTYGGQLLEKPLTSRYKGLVTLNWKPMMALWQFDVTLSLNGGGRMPTPYLLADGTPSWSTEFPAYVQLSAQVTREFRHFSLYVGGENLTNYRQPHPIINAANPWASDFEPTLIWGPVHGIMAYAGIRMNLK